MNMDSDTGAVSFSLPTVSIDRPAIYVVATPIGNLGDISLRALAILHEVDVIACEDKRHSIRLLNAYGISTPLTALHEHNEQQRAGQLLDELLDANQAAALICDAGTPLVSDPGFVLVRTARERGVPVLAIPGASAVTAALSSAGLPVDRYAFEGFLPVGTGARQKYLQSLVDEIRTLVFYEAPHRITATLGAMEEAFGQDRRVVVMREITKQFEHFYGGTLAQVRQQMVDDEYAERGELVILVAAAERNAEVNVDDALLRTLLRETDHKTALRIAIRHTGRGRNELYRRLLELAEHDHGSS